jgi:hypothetical protein
LSPLEQGYVAIAVVSILVVLAAVALSYLCERPGPL